MPTVARSWSTWTSPTSANTRSRSSGLPSCGGSPPASSASCCATSTPGTPGPANFRLFCPDETNSNRLGNVFEVENRCFVGRTLDIDDHVSPDGRVMEVLSEHLCEGWLEGYTLTGRHGLFATYEAFAMVSASMTVQHTKWLQEAIEPPLAGTDRVAQHPAHVDVLAQRPQRLQPPGPRLDRRDALQAGHGDAHLPAARCQLPAVGRRSLPPQPQLREPDRDRQAAAAPVPGHGDGHQTLRERCVDLGAGEQRQRRRARRGAGRRR